MKNSDTPAYPQSNKELVTAFMELEQIAPNGFTKREAFAMAAMQNVILNYNPWEHGDFDSSNYEDAATQAVGLADALLAELEK